MKRIHWIVAATSHGVFAKRRCTADCMEVRTAWVGYPERTANCIHRTHDNRNAPHECRNGSVLERADKKTLVVRLVFVAHKLCRGAPNFNRPCVSRAFGCEWQKTAFVDTYNVTPMHRTDVPMQDPRQTADGFLSRQGHRTPPPPCASTATVPEVTSKWRFNAHPVLRQGRARARHT